MTGHFVTIAVVVGLGSQSESVKVPIVKEAV